MGRGGQAGVGHSGLKTQRERRKHLLHKNPKHIFARLSPVHMVLVGACWVTPSGRLQCTVDSTVRIQYHFRIEVEDF